MAHIIDTDVLIDVTKSNAAAIAFLESLPDCAISAITAMELIAGELAPNWPKEDP